MGRLRSERVKRPQGETIRVYLDNVVRQVPVEVPPGQVSGDQPKDVPSGTNEQVLIDEDRSQVLAVWAASLLAPIAAELGAARETIVGQAGEIAALREERGRQSAELERAASTVVALSDQLTAADRTRQRDERRHRIGLAVAGTLAIVAAVAPAWVR